MNYTGLWSDQLYKMEVIFHKIIYHSCETEAGAFKVRIEEKNLFSCHCRPVDLCLLPDRKQAAHSAGLPLWSKHVTIHVHQCERSWVWSRPNSSHLWPLIPPCRLTEWLEPGPAVLGRKAGHTLDKSLVHRRAEHDTVQRRVGMWRWSNAKGKDCLMPSQSCPILNVKYT